MSITLSPLSTRRSAVGAADDPFKKYWWVILFGFGVTGSWIFLPMMESSVGSEHVSSSSKSSMDPSSAEQNLDSADNPNGAPGGALDLSMGGLKHKSRSDEAMSSMLYQAPPESGVVGASAAGAPLGLAGAISGASLSLAQQLKAAGRQKDAAGWGEKAQSGFSGAHLSGGGLPGAGSVSGGASSSGGGGGGAFGMNSAHTGSASTVGLHDNGGSDASGPGGSLGSRKSGAGAKALGKLNGGAEALRSGVGGVFDGSGKGISIRDGMDNASAGLQAAYDEAPANLKLNDPKLNAKKLPDPPVVAPPTPPGPDMVKQLAMMAASAFVGGLLGGEAGQMVMMAGMMLMQQQQQKAAADAAKQQQVVNKRTGWM
jgi:hypothetical protein